MLDTACAWATMGRRFMDRALVRSEGNVMIGIAIPLNSPKRLRDCDASRPYRFRAEGIIMFSKLDRTWEMARFAVNGIAIANRVL